MFMSTRNAQPERVYCLSVIIFYNMVFAPPAGKAQWSYLSWTRSHRFQWLGRKDWGDKNQLGLWEICSCHCYKASNSLSPCWLVLNCARWYAWVFSFESAIIIEDCPGLSQWERIFSMIRKDCLSRNLSHLQTTLFFLESVSRLALF